MKAVASHKESGLRQDLPRQTPTRPNAVISNSPEPRKSVRGRVSLVDLAVFGLASVWIIVYLVWVVYEAIASKNSGALVPIVTQEALAILSIVAAVLGFRASVKRELDRATRRAWVLFAAAQIATGIVSISWVYRMGWGNPVAGPLALQLVAASYDLLMLWALVTFPVRRLESADRSMFWLDGGIVAAVAAVLTWHLLLRAALVAAGSDWRTSIYALSYPVGDVILLFAAVALLLRRPLPGSVRAIRIMAASILLNAAADILYMWAYIAKEAQGTRPFYVAWAIIAWMMAAAAFSQLSQLHLDAGSVDGVATSRPRQSTSPIPYFAIVAIYLTLLIEAYRTEAAASLLNRHASLAARFPVTTLVAGAIVVTAIVIARQIAAQRRNADLAAEHLAQEAHFRALVQHSSDMVLLLDSTGTVREASPAVARVLGHAPDAVIGRKFFDFFADEDRAVVQADLAQASATDADSSTESGPCEWRIRDANGGERWVEAICTNLLADPVVAGLVINGRDVSERKQLEAELTHRAYHDPLTGLVNRSRFRTKVVDAIGRAYSGTRPGDGRSGLAILYIDLDGFKAVNDIFGHDAGDLVLAAVADRLRDATRGSDTAARLGGDEFAILLERLRDTEEVRMVAERVLQLVRRPVRIDHREVVVGASIGIVCTSLGGDAPDETVALDPDMLLRNADSAMYAAKARGRGNYEFFVPVSDGIV
jgi:diguanylate cyclase (GGDEF)-like protein/PAS domain S-box-containing protein